MLKSTLYLVGYAMMSHYGLDSAWSLECHVYILYYILMYVNPQQAFAPSFLVIGVSNSYGTCNNMQDLHSILSGIVDTDVQYSTSNIRQ